MVDALDDADTRRGRDGVATQLAALIVVVGAVDLVGPGGAIAFGDGHGGDLEIVLGLAGRVGAEEEAVDRVGFVGG